MRSNGAFWSITEGILRIVDDKFLMAAEMLF